jgi:hypothetical protein
MASVYGAAAAIIAIGIGLLNFLPLPTPAFVKVIPVPKEHTPRLIKLKEDVIVDAVPHTKILYEGKVLLAGAYATKYTCIVCVPNVMCVPWHVMHLPRQCELARILPVAA